MRWSILLLICASISFAQPVYGPYLLATSQESQSFGNVLVAMDASSIAHVFYHISANGTHSVVYTAINTTNGNVASLPETIFTTTTNEFLLEDVALTPAGVPKCLIYTSNLDDYRLYLIEPSVENWSETLLFQDHDGWSPEHGTLTHGLQSCRFVCAQNDYTQVCLYNTGVDGGPFLEPFALPVACFVRPGGEVSSFPLGQYSQVTYGTLRCQSLGPDSMYLWTNGFGADFYKLIARSDSTYDELIFYDGDNCMFGEFGGLNVSGGDQIQINNTFLCIPICMAFTRVHDDTCSLLRMMYFESPPMIPPASVAVYENHGFAFPLFIEDEVRLMRVDTLIESVAATGTLAWRDGPVRITDARSGVSPSGEIAIVWKDINPVTNVKRLWLASCNWLTPLGVNDHAAPLPQEISLTTYPNPFNSTVRIDYDLPRASDLTLSIYNSLGQQVATLFDGNSQAGAHSMSWTPKISSGVYFVHLQTYEFVTSSKVLYIR